MNLVKCYFKDNVRFERIYKALRKKHFKYSFQKEIHYKQEYIDNSGFKQIAFISPSGKYVRGISL